MSNLYGDLLKIAEGDVSIVEQRVTEFRDFANTVPAAPQSDDGQDAGWSASSSEPVAEAPGAPSTTPATSGGGD